MSEYLCSPDQGRAKRLSARAPHDRTPHTHTPLAYDSAFADASPRPGWYKVFGNTLAEVDHAMRSGQTRTERLPRPLPVNLIYSTVGLNEYRALYFKPDIYGEDARLARFLGLDLL